MSNSCAMAIIVEDLWSSLVAKTGVVPLIVQYGRLRGND